MKYKSNLKIILFVLILSNIIVFPQKQRAMWVWNSSNEVNNIINNLGEYRKQLFDFCKSPHGNSDKKITHLFFSCSGAIYSYQENLKNFIAEASDSGITVEYLDGDPTWATYKQYNGFDRIAKVLEFNANSKNEKEKLKGIQFDVEPYLLTQARGYQPPHWDTDKMTVWETYVNYMDSCQTLVDNGDSNLIFGIAIPRWYENQVGLNELKRLQEKVDYVAIMDYNENAGVIINDAANEINYAEELNRKVWIGVETQEISPETVSFYEEGVSFMESQLDSALSVYGTNEVFLGFAIHAYKYYRLLIENPTAVEIDNNIQTPNDILLNQNFPNPFNPTTKIKYSIPINEKRETSNVKILVFDILGKEIATLVNQKQNPGNYEVTFDASEFNSGVYFYKIISGNFIETKKMILMK
ncbi:MAG: T9SS type A sorting domain-containing protein [Ignavibacteriae bacterium]|nr:T9SS type A sorting domain-containing protein [Ignavibacteriota bacterium]